MLVYKVTNKVNGKVYVGQTIHPLEYRKKKHMESAKYNNKFLFGRAISKYGIGNFKFETLIYCGGRFLMNCIETEYIKYYDSNNPEYGYNISSGGSSSPAKGEKHFRYGKTLSLNHKRKISEAHKGKVLSDKHKEKIRKYRLGKKLTVEHKEKISKALKGKRKTPFTEEHKRKLSLNSPIRRNDLDLEIDEIIKMHESGVSLRKIAKIFNTNHDTIKVKINNKRI